MEILGQAKAANSLADNNEYTALNNGKDTLDQNFQGIEFACIHQIKVEWLFTHLQAFPLKLNPPLNRVWKI